MFRNREVRQFAYFFFLITAVTIFLGFIIHPAAGVLAGVSAVLFGTAFFLFTKPGIKLSSYFRNKSILCFMMRTIYISVMQKRVSFHSAK